MRTNILLGSVDVPDDFPPALLVDLVRTFVDKFIAPNEENPKWMRGFLAEATKEGFPEKIPEADDTGALVSLCIKAMLWATFEAWRLAAKDSPEEKARGLSEAFECINRTIH